MGDLINFFKDIERRASELPEDARLEIMAQNPANHFHWSKSIGSISAGDLVRMARFAARFAASEMERGDG